MSSYIDAYKLIVAVRTFFVKLINEAEPLMADDEEAFDLKIVNPLLEANKAIRRIIREQPRVDVVPYSIEDGKITIDLSGIIDKIQGCAINVYFGKSGADMRGENNEQIH